MTAPTKNCVACHLAMTHVRDDLWRCPVHGISDMRYVLCSQIDSCYKMDMILDKDILGFQAADAIRSVSATCTVRAEG